MSQKTLDQRRAEHAWNAVTSLAKSIENGDRKYDSAAEEYAIEAKKLPIRIMGSGLGQALAFILAKAKDKKPKLKQLHIDLTNWVKERNLQMPVPDSLMQSIFRGDSSFQRRATDEILAYLQWLNRFIEAEGLKTDGGN